MKNLLRKIPNILTLIRVALIPIFVIFFLIPENVWHGSNLAAWGVFTLAALTDLADGYLARKLQVCSKFGAFLDPVADKIMVCVALVLLVGYFTSHSPIEYGYADDSYKVMIGYIVTLCSAVIISREIVISALREWMAEIGSRAKVAVSWIGKWKTTVQMISIAGLIWRDTSLIFRDHWMVTLSLILMLIATFLTIWSMISYLRVGLKTMDD